MGSEIFQCLPANLDIKWRWFIIDFNSVDVTFDCNLCTQNMLQAKTAFERDPRSPVALYIRDFLFDETERFRIILKWLWNRWRKNKCSSNDEEGSQLLQTTIDLVTTWARCPALNLTRFCVFPRQSTVRTS